MKRLHLLLILILICVLMSGCVRDTANPEQPGEVEIPQIVTVEPSSDADSEVASDSSPVSNPGSGDDSDVLPSTDSANQDEVTQPDTQTPSGLDVEEENVTEVDPGQEVGGL